MNTFLSGNITYGFNSIRNFVFLILSIIFFGIFFSKLEAAADLTVSSISGPTGAGIGSTVVFNVTIKNDGDANVTTDFEVEVTIDGTSAVGTTTFSASTNVLEAAASAVVQVSLIVPDVAKNAYDVTATADSDTDIA